ncbi:Formyltetrahydrofolate deformylase [Croceitalea dokdonensis DOKDO 023]|uniref:Formyltetrahydrofolate deformylase n=1 Tax=Croceitalea dokdonensis DOKDO 023 TaxID=1300341 RepID=A0A0P7AEX7_9FLAO|nr:formyltetrahydrofolate deformylase [Croceitalea dokdonensis]KPM30726.1 Formyltetrahydrofolate deformylase [Croceitalea dokdonensis DOKDO 023]
MHLTFLIHCPDQPGIIQAVTRFLFSKGGNVVYLDQHVDKDARVFFMRIESEFNHSINTNDLRASFQKELGNPFAMQWQAYSRESKPKMALFVSKYEHCLYDILARYHSGELAVAIPFIISNHKDMAHIAQQFKLPYYHIPVTRATKATAEDQQLQLLKKYQVDFIVLARYMQIVSPKIINEYPNKIINIHHSFLPAFAGAKPYHAAFERGVKIIGATSHYVTEELDAGPIIAQDVAPVSHSHSIKDFITQGRDLEKIVLSKAIKLHVNRKTMVYQNKTVIFT